jgi:hypothetical protein
VAQPYCFAKYYEIPGYEYAFYEVECATAPGVLTVYQTYTNEAGVTQSFTPQINIVSTTSSTPPSTTAQAAQATGGTIINCGNGGSNGNTCNVGSGNNGNGGKIGSASPAFSSPPNGLLVHVFAFWVLSGLAGLVFL